MCVLKGFPTALKTKTAFPFGVWFANANTVYVADEGNGDNTYDPANMIFPNAAAQPTAGLEKWIFDTSTQQWNLAYTLQKGLGLGAPYTISGYPTGLNLATCIVAKGQPNPNNCPVSKTLPSQFSAPNGLPWSPATDGLRNITGILNADGTATIYAITSTVSGNGDQGADPNQLVAVTDMLSAAGPTAPPGESFTTLRAAGNLEVLRGVSLTPGS
jgi:hypothetical protein